MKNKTILILGVSSSIGIQLLKKLIDKNYHIIGQFQNKNKELIQLKTIYKDNLILIKSDFSNSLDCSNLLKYLDGNINELDAYIHLISPKINMKPIARTTWNEISDNLDIQLKSLFLTMQVCIKKLSKVRNSRVIVLNSEVVKQKPIPKGFTAYSIAKSAINQYLECLMSETQNLDININQISPTMFESPLLENIPKYVIESSKKLSDINPLDDIIPKILFLLSDEGSNIKGEDYIIK